MRLSYAWLLLSLFAIMPLLGQQSTPAPATPAVTGCNLVLHVDHLRNSRGKVGTAIYNSPTGWPENTEKALLHGPSDIVSTANGLASTKVWENLPPGDYAVVAIHDENSNHKLDKNFFGIPTEGFGFANNPHVGLTAPRFQAAIVHLACPSTETTIHIQYR